MQRVRLICAVKHDSPLIVGDEGAILTLPTPVAQFAVANKFGVYHGGEIDAPGPSRSALEAEEAAIKAGGLKTLDETREAENQPPAEEIKKPYGNAPKSAWVRYAVSVDSELSEERAEDMTKADLMSKYGSRLGDEE